MMKSEDRRWIRYLGGELGDEERRLLEKQLRQNAPSARPYGQMREVWQQLEGPPPSSVEPEFSAQVVAAARRMAEPMSWRQAPVWARLAATVALVSGVALGSLASAREGLGGLPADRQSVEQDVWSLAPGSTAGAWAFSQAGLWPDEPPEPDVAWPEDGLGDEP